MSGTRGFLTEKNKAGRYKKMRAFLNVYALDAVFVCGDGPVSWLAGEFMRYPDAFVLFTQEREPVLFVSNPARSYVLYGLEKNRKDFWIQDYRINEAREMEKALQQLPRTFGRIGVTARGFSMEAYKTLSRLLPDSELVDISEEYQAIRRIKEEEDIELLRRSAAVVDNAVQALAREVRPGMFENELKAVMERSMYEDGAHDTLNLCNTDFSDLSFVSMPGDHCPARLIEGMAVCCEVTACYRQMWTQQIVHLSIGEPSRKFRELHDACRAGHDAAAALIGPGVNARDIVNAACDVIEAMGYMSGRSFMSGPPGHLVGFERDEGTFSYDRDFILKENMVLDLHFSAAVPGWKPGMPAVFGPGSTFLVTADGAGPLNRYPNDIIRC